jgi:hypothetical protein
MWQSADKGRSVPSRCTRWTKNAGTISDTPSVTLFGDCESKWQVVHEQKNSDGERRTIVEQTTIPARRRWVGAAVVMKQKDDERITVTFLIFRPERRLFRTEKFVSDSFLFHAI